MNLYEIALGERNRIYYLTKFERYDQKGSGLRMSWNWSAFFFSYLWALYRKMYGWFFTYMVVIVLAVILDASGYLDFTRVPGLAIIATIPMWIVFSVYANSLYHKSIKRKITNAQAKLIEEPKLLEYLRHKGGVHKWVMWASIPIIMFPIFLLIISIPLLDR